MTSIQPMFTLIVPVYNGKTTLGNTIDSIVSFADKQLLDLVVLVDDCSDDGSVDLLRSRLDSMEANDKSIFKILHNSTRSGLAKSIENALAFASTDFTIIMHQDIVIRTPHVLSMLLGHFRSDRKIDVVMTELDMPLDIYIQYSFWQKCLFCRLIGRKAAEGKFDCFRTDILRSYIHTGKHYFCAGEFSHIYDALDQDGRTFTIAHDITGEHHHSFNRNFGILHWLKKEAVYAEGNGAMLRNRSRIVFRKHYWQTVFREALLIGLFIPYIRIACVCCILYYSISYTWNVYRTEWNNWRILLLPLLNIATIPLHSFFFVCGFITGKQQLIRS